MIFIQSKNDGFRRCGVTHTMKGQEFPDDFFTDAQLEELNADTEIIMVAVTPGDLELEEPQEEKEAVPGQDKEPAPTKTKSSWKKASK